MPWPENKSDLRAETNGTIHEYNRQMRAEILRMVQAEAAASEEHKVQWPRMHGTIEGFVLATHGTTAEGSVSRPQ